MKTDISVKTSNVSYLTYQRINGGGVNHETRRKA